MIYYNNKSNLLEDTIYHYELQDVAEPELFREMFDYESIPKIAFNNRHVPINMPDEIWMTDTTFRDGQQSTSPFTVRQIVDLYKLMARLGGPKGLVRQSGVLYLFPKGQGGAQSLPGYGAEIPRDHDVDPRRRQGLRARQRGGRRRDGHSGELLGLSYLQKDAPDAPPGAR